jgi:HD superfamily phosphohydrolase
MLAAALIHDIGQYPFAHTIEDLRELGDYVKDSRLQNIYHDHELVERVISAPGHRDSKGRTIRDILTMNGFNVEDILYIISKKSIQHISPALRVSHDLIAKVIDLDRVAYLLHDSERSGVPYGNAIDVESLLDALTIAGSYKDFAASQDSLQLGIEDSGVSAAEAVLAAVYWMYRNVYWRHTNRAFMAMIKAATRHLFTKTDISFERYWNDTHGMSEIDALKYLHDLFDIHKPTNSVNHLAALLNLQRLGYSRVKTIHPLHKASRVVHKRIRKHLTVTIEDDLAILIEQYLRTLGLTVARGMVLADIPLKGHLRESVSLPVIAERHLSRRQRDESKDFLSYSRLASRLSRMERSEASRIRIFITHELTTTMSQNQMAEFEDNLLKHLETVLPT